MKSAVERVTALVVATGYGVGVYFYPGGTRACVVVKHGNGRKEKDVELKGLLGEDDNAIAETVVALMKKAMGASAELKKLEETE